MLINTVTYELRWDPQVQSSMAPSHPLVVWFPDSSTYKHMRAGGRHLGSKWWMCVSSFLSCWGPWDHISLCSRLLLCLCVKRGHNDQWPGIFGRYFAWKWKTSTQVHRPAERGLYLVAVCQIMLLGSQSGGSIIFIQTVTFRFCLCIVCVCQCPTGPALMNL